MIDFSAIESVSRITNRINEIETKLGLRLPNRPLQAAAQTKAAPAKDMAPSKAQEPSFDSLLQKEMTKPTTGREYAETIRNAAAKYGVDSRLVSAVAEAESGFDQSSVSGAGAIGIMQLMPETASNLGVNPYDAQQNIEGGAKYLSQMLKTFGGDVRKAVAAYNAGPQAVIDHNGVPPYSETQNYVNTVLDLYR